MLKILLAFLAFFVIISRYVDVEAIKESVPFLWKDNGDELVGEMKQHVLLAYGAYCSPDDIKKWDCYWCKQSSLDFKLMKLHYDTHYNLLFYIGTVDDTLYLVFRGTPSPLKSLRDWLLDFDLQEKTTPGYGPPGVRVHKGMWKMFNHSMQQEMVDSVNEALKKDKKLTKIRMTGHSLGCSFCDYSAHVLFDNGNSQFQKILKDKNVYLMHFASLRTGNQDFVDYIVSKIPASNIYRVVNKRDTATSIPSEKLTSYRHLPTEYWFKGKSCCDYIKCDGTGEDHRCSDGVWMWNPVDHAGYLGYDFFDGTSSDCWGGKRNTQAGTEGHIMHFREYYE